MMFKITEVNSRMKHLAKPRKSPINTWFAVDEKNFISEIKKISTIGTEAIFSKNTSEDILWRESEMTPEDLDPIDPEDTWGPCKHLLRMGHWYGWYTTLYRADFIENRENFSKIDSDYSEYPISEFEAYKAFLEFVSPGVIIEEIRLSNDATDFISFESEQDQNIGENIQRVA